MGARRFCGKWDYWGGMKVAPIEQQYSGHSMDSSYFSGFISGNSSNDLFWRGNKKSSSDYEICRVTFGHFDEFDK